MTIGDWIGFRHGQEPQPLQNGLYEAEVEEGDRFVVEGTARLIRSDFGWYYAENEAIPYDGAILRVRRLPDPEGGAGTFHDTLRRWLDEKVRPALEEAKETLLPDARVVSNREGELALVRKTGIERASLIYGLGTIESQAFGASPNERWRPSARVTLERPRREPHVLDFDAAEDLTPERVRRHVMALAENRGFSMGD